MKDILISETISLKDAYKKLDQTAEKVLLVVNEKKQLLGTLTDGDVRRALLKGKSLETGIKDHYNDNPVKILDYETKSSEVNKLFYEKKVELIPVVDENDTIIDYVTWQSCFGVEEKPKKFGDLQNIPVVIMAGGKGTRLAPFTDILPKPLIPINGKSIIEIIIDEFRKFKINSFFLTLNYKGKLIEAYLDSVTKDYNTEFVWEGDFLGTAGSVKLIEPGKLKENFIVSNCDIIVKADYSAVIEFHTKSKALITVVSSIQHHKVPYGVIEFKDGGKIIGIKEKPEFSFTINTGVYILNKKCLNFIPDKQYFNMTDLIYRLIEEGKNVVTYPVNENEYVDIGQWDEYRLSIDKMKL